jgi:hypothetical protein
MKTWQSLFAFLLLIPVQTLGVDLPPSPSSANFSLRAGPFTTSDLGSPIQAATLSSSIMFRHPVSQQVHYLYLYYEAAHASTVPFQILDLNLDTGESRLVDGGLGRPDPASPVVYPGNGKVYIVAQTSPGSLTSYDALTGVARPLHRLADVCAQSLTIGDDLRLYLGEAVKGYLEVYDPAQDPGEEGAAAAWTNWGIVNDPGAPYYRYVYTNGSDGHYVYMAVRDQNRSPSIWFFAVRDLSSGEERVFFGDDPTVTYISAQSSRRGYGVACVSSTQASRRCYRFDGFTQGALVDPNNLPGTPVAIDWPQLSPAGYSVSLDENEPDSANGGVAIIKWKKPGDSAWRRAEVPGVHLENVPIRNLYSSGTDLLGLPEAYAPSFSFNTTSQTPTILGRMRLSPYNALYSALHRKWYVTGYPSAWAEYDVTKPWSLTYADNYFNVERNPHWMTQTPGGMGAKYLYYIGQAADGFIYFGGHQERDATGGSMHWYHPVTAQGGHLREPFLQYDSRGLASAMRGTKMVLSTTTCCGGTGNGKLFVLDTATKAIEREIVAPAGADAGAIIEVAQGIILGASGTTLYTVDIRTGSILKTVTVPATAFGGVVSNQRRFVPGPDGYLWLYLGDSVYRVHPLTLAAEKILDASPAANLTFHGKDLYVSGRGRTNIRKIGGLFKAKALQLRTPALGKVIRGRKVRCGWRTARGAVRYTLQISTNQRRWTNVGSTSALLFEYSGLQRHKQYFWRVRAERPGKSAVRSPVWSFFTE